jgi:hypothetical protein
VAIPVLASFSASRSTEDFIADWTQTNSCWHLGGRFVWGGVVGRGDFLGLFELFGFFSGVLHRQLSQVQGAAAARTQKNDVSSGWTDHGMKNLTPGRIFEEDLA